MNNNLNNLMTKYECSYILNMKKKDKNFLKALVKYIKETNFTVKNKTIITLIYNYFFKKSLLPNVNYITGPFSLSYHYIPSLDKKIYIFGENHNSRHLCSGSLNSTFIVDYMVELFINTNVVIDFYIEDKLTKIEIVDEELEHLEKWNKDNPDETLEKLRMTFLYCRKNKEKKPWCIPNRIHYSDLRIAHFYDISKYTDMYENDAEVYKMMYRFFLIESMETSEEKMIKLNQIDKSLFKKIFDKIHKSDSNYFFNEILKNKNIKKQYNKNNIKIKNLITTFFKQQISNYIIKVLNNYFIKKYNSKTIDNFYNSSDNIDTFFYFSRFFNDISVLHMDMYLLCRLFVTYDNTKREDYYPSEQKNIIIYAGNAHSILYRDFILFSKLSTININSQLGQYGNTDNCLNMTGIPQPFFSNAL
jgi:hypothetical protein